MHLWPTKNLRDSFKLSYLKNLEWNYRRMENQKDQQSQSQSSTEQKLMENKNMVDDGDSYAPKREAGAVVSLCQDLLLLLSCCYCCFCCSACVEEK